MAYVRRTDTLMYEVLQKVSEMGAKAREPYLSSRIEEGTPEYDALYNSVEDVVWKEAPELKGKLPDAWLEHATFPRIELRVPKQEGKDHVTLNVPDGGRPFKLSPRYNDKDRSGWRTPTAFVEYSRADIPPVVSAFYDKQEQLAIKRGEIDGKYSKIRDSLRAFMMAHASLNKMIEAMPEFEHYVPQKYLDKLRKPNEKRDTKVEITIVDELNIDTNELAALAVGHRIATAQS